MGTAPAHVSLFANHTINRFSIITSTHLLLEEPGKSHLGGVWSRLDLVTMVLQVVYNTVQPCNEDRLPGSGTETLPNRTTGHFNDPTVKGV